MTDPSLSEIARQLAAARRPKERACRACGKPFVTVGRGLYCSKECAVRDRWRRWYQAHREEYLSKRRKAKASGAGDSQA